MQYLTVHEAALVARRGLRFVYRALNRGELRGRKLGGRWVIKREWLEAWLEGRPVHDFHPLGREHAAANVRRMLAAKREGRRKAG